LFYCGNNRAPTDCCGENDGVAAKLKLKPEFKKDEILRNERLSKKEKAL